MTKLEKVPLHLRTKTQDTRFGDATSLEIFSVCSSSTAAWVIIFTHFQADDHLALPGHLPLAVGGSGRSSLAILDGVFPSTKAGSDKEDQTANFDVYLILGTAASHDQPCGFNACHLVDTH